MTAYLGIITVAVTGLWGIKKYADEGRTTREQQAATAARELEQRQHEALAARPGAREIVVHLLLQLDDEQRPQVDLAGVDLSTAVFAGSEVDPGTRLVVDNETWRDAGLDGAVPAAVVSSPGVARG